MAQSDLDFLNSLSSTAASSTATTPAQQPTPDPANAPDPTVVLSQLQSQLQSTLSINLGGQDGSDLSEEDILKLLEQIENADNAADGLESRLDSLLGTLDTMLDTLGSGEELGTVQEGKEETEEATPSAEKEVVPTPIGGETAPTES